MSDVWTSGDVTLYHGDCLEILPTLEDGSVDAVVTDPPYGVGLRYAGFDDTEEAWMQTVPAMLAMMQHQTCIMFGSSPHLLKDLTGVPREPDRVLIWSPRFSLSKSQSHGMFYRWHPIYCWNLPDGPHDGPSMDVLREPCDGRNWWNHPGTKPESLMRRLVQIAARGATVLDPFMGSGTTGVACVQTGRRFIGIELDEGYFEIAKRRIIEAQMQPRLEGM